MKGAHASMLLQAIEEMKQRYEGLHLTRHRVRFRTILRRSTTLSAQDKQNVEDQLHMYDSLLDQDPDIQERVAKAKVEGQQKAVMEVIEVRFPALLEEAQPKIASLNKSDQLSLVLKQMVTVSDEPIARWLLNTLAA